MWNVSLQPVRAQVRWNVLDAPQPVGSRLDAKAHLPGRGHELGFDVPRHQAPLFDLQVARLETCEIHVGPGQGDPCGALVFLEPLGVDAFNLVEVLVETPRIVRRLTQHLRQVHVV